MLTSLFSWLVLWVVNAAAVFVSGRLIRGIEVEKFTSALAAAAVISLSGFLLGPLLRLFLGPLNWLPFIPFLLGALFFWLASLFVPGFKVRGPVAALLGSLLLGFLNGAAHWFFHI
ncbi:MAG: phage holin family protein [Armatimonadetes bacterium]|nr:phage holin family protein [Armatimonadota bacterium]